jgi:hypothetical protein
MRRGGHAVLTIRGAPNYIMKLPKAEQNLEEWQAAIECLILVAERDGPTMMARMGLLRRSIGMSNGFSIKSRKDTHWGKRKFKRDQ